MTEIQNLTEVVFILDRSGSMEHIAQDTIGGFNSMIQKQKKENTNALVTTVIFDDKIDIIHDRIKIENVPTLTDKEYFARGCTALLDAVGTTIKHISNIHKYIKEDDVPGKTLFIITTDGYENASKEYDVSKVKSMIEDKKSNHNWEFLYLGADIDAVDEAQKIGIESDYAATIMKDRRGMDVFYQTISDVVCCKSKMLNDTKLDKNWKFQIDDDFKKRNKSTKK